jgi:hypothetical protein|tara:strand:+ start:203 stop:481 length:279 start_codon:yes stop_codon:yes gene_type:complete
MSDPKKIKANSLHYKTTMTYQQYAKAAKILKTMKKRLLDIPNKGELPTTDVQQCRQLKSTRGNVDKLMFLLDEALWADNPEPNSKEPNYLFF